MPHDSLTDRAQALHIPLPDSPWFGYCVIPVTSCLRPPDEESGVTPDMCVPIQPNKGHPLGREGLETQPTFPFDNCYHWSLSEMKIRVAASEDGFDMAIAVKLGAGEDNRRERLFFEDSYRQTEALKAKTDLSALLADCDDANPAPAQADNSNERASLCSYESSVSDSYSYAGSIDAMTEMGMFGDPSSNAELQPLVNLWLDFGSRFTKDDIANPVHFLEEIDTITK